MTDGWTVVRRRVQAAVLAVGLLASSFGSPTVASAATCAFVLGFRTLHDLIPATVGDCVVDEHHNPANGDGLQETAGRGGAGGLLVWRKADNWTAYTDGYHTWINGPAGLQERLNTGPLFPWEAGAPPPVASAPPPTAVGQPARFVVVSPSTLVVWGSLVGSSGGAFTYYTFNSPSSRATGTVTLVVSPRDPVTNSTVGVNLLQGGATLAALSPASAVPGVNSAGFPLTTGGPVSVQVYNYQAGATAVYTIVISGDGVTP